MGILIILLTILGLCIFEVITSIDNAIINAEVLSTMTTRGRKWFLSWGMLFAVFVVRGLLPFLILWATMPNVSPAELIRLTLTNNDVIKAHITESSHILLLGGGIFLLFIFLHWLFLEPKNFGLKGERFFNSKGAWFFATASIVLTIVVWFALNKNSMLAFGAVIGSTAFFIVHGFRQYAEEKEKSLVKYAISDFSKIIYLEILDLTFSIDGVVGAFAFTLSVPLILIGNGLGAIILRKITVSNIERIKRYIYLKNGAMYSIFFLGLIMILDGFGHEIPPWISPIIMLITVSYFFKKSGSDIL